MKVRGLGMAEGLVQAYGGFTNGGLAVGKLVAGAALGVGCWGMSGTLHVVEGAS